MSVIENYQRIKREILALEEKYHRAPGSVQLLAVSKTRSADEVLKLYNEGQSAFGENYLQEALNKIEALEEHRIEWHFIGSIQSKKSKALAENFRWVHSVDRLKVAEKLNLFSEASNPLNVLVQVNLEGEASKGGVAPKELGTLLNQVNKLENLRLRGLMFMPMIHKDIESQRAVFARAHSLFQKYQGKFVNFDQLSMGMTGDMEAAIAEGSTIVRIGTALFGLRDK